MASYPLLSQAPTPVEVELGCDNNISAGVDGGLSRGSGCADQGAMTPIGTSGNSILNQYIYSNSTKQNIS